MDRAALWAILGDLPTNHEIEAEKLKEEIHADGYLLESWILDLNGEERVPAYIAKPMDMKNPLPLVLVNHSHGGMYERGKKELIEPSHYLQEPSYAKSLTDMGYIAASIDMWGFGDRQRNEHDLVKEMLWRGKTVWGSMIYDNHRFLDYLLECSDVDSSRVAAIGMSMGAMQSWWLAALDERIQLTIDMGGQVDAHTLMKQRKFSKHGFYYYIPGLLKKWQTAEIQKLIIPRRRLSLVGKFDDNCPLEGVQLLDSELIEAYANLGASGNWECKLFGCGHKETIEMRSVWLKYLEQYL